MADDIVYPLGHFEQEDHWNHRLLALSRFISGWSKDPSTKIGCVIVDAKHRVVSVGYNGFPRCVEDLDDRYANREVKYALTVHAEQNAILNAGRPVDGCSLYVSGLPPCQDCAKVIIQAGLKAVYHQDIETPERWQKSCFMALMMFKEAGVSVFKIKTNKGIA